MGIPHGDTRPQRVNHLVILYDYGSRRAEHMVQSFQQSLRLLAAGLLATLGLYLLLRRYVGRPLLQLATFADRLAEDPSSMRIRYTGRGEVAKLAEALNEMSERITAALVQTRASERDLSTTLDAIRDGVIVTDAAGAIIRMNPAAETLTGWPRADAFGRSLMDILPMTGAESDGPVINPLELALIEGQPAGVANHCTMVARDGRELQVSESAAPILSDLGELRGVVLVLRDITDHSTAMQRIEQLALYDPLTSLPNRRTFMERLEQEIARSQRHKHFGALLYLDLDQFKLVNDSLGHQVGDQLLVSVANRLRGAIRREDMPARLGGDEFVVLLPDLGSEERAVSERALSVAKKISAALYHAFPLQSNEIYVTPSIGVTIYPRRGVDANGALQQADIAMYRAKSDGRNTVRLFCASLQQAVEQRAALQAALHRAIEKDAFRLFLQPICKADGRITGAEVLLRWVDEQGTLRLPAEFLQLAEETGLMQRMGEKVLQGACRQMRRLRTLIGEGQACPISVNVSACQLRHPGFVELVRKTLAAHDLPGSALVLEITEQVLLEDLEEVSAKLGALREDNVRFAIDDFGAGHSSLS